MSAPLRQPILPGADPVPGPELAPLFVDGVPVDADLQPIPPEPAPPVSLSIGTDMKRTAVLLDFGGDSGRIALSPPQARELVRLVREQINEIERYRRAQLEDVRRSGRGSKGGRR